MGRVAVDEPTTWIVVAVVVVAMVATGLPLRRTPLDVRSRDGVTTVRASSWTLLPPAFGVTLWLAGAPHVPEDRGMLAVLLVFSAMLGGVTWLAWRNCRAELATDRIVTRASWTGRRIAHVRRAGATPQRIYLGPTGAFYRRHGLFLNGNIHRGGGRSSGREFGPMAGLTRGSTWAYRALRAAAVAGNWPERTTLVVYLRPSRGQQRLLDDIAACGVEVEDRTHELRSRDRAPRSTR